MPEDRKLLKICENVRKEILLMSYRAKSAHVGGSLSSVEILVSLYFKILNIFPNDPNNVNRDRLILSKAHDVKALYAVLAERGFFNKEILKSYEKDGGKLPGHSTRNCVPGVEVSAGSLGHGLSMAAGMAYVGKLDKKKHKVFVLLSDGECDEGSVWEAILFSGHHKLDNLIAIIDYNGFQGFGATNEVLNLEPFAKKWECFGWATKEANGHNIEEIISSLENLPFEKDKPSVLIAHTIKGKGGVIENEATVESHYKSITEDNLRKLKIIE